MMQPDKGRQINGLRSHTKQGMAFYFAGMHLQIIKPKQYNRPVKWQGSRTIPGKETRKQKHDKLINDVR